MNAPIKISLALGLMIAGGALGAAAPSDSKPSRTVIETSDPGAERYISSGAQAFARGDFSAAVESWQQAADGFAKASVPGRRIDALLLVGAAYQSMGHSTDAISSLDRAVALADALAKQTGDRHRLIAAKNALGGACMFTEQADRAQDLLQQALDAATADNDQALLPRIQNNLGTLLSARRGKLVEDEPPDLNDYNKAIVAFDAAVQGARNTTDPVLAAKALVNKAVAAIHNRQYDDALDFDAEAIKAVAALPDSRDKISLELTIGRSDQAALDSGAGATNKDEIIRREFNVYQAALDMSRRMDDDLSASYALGLFGRLYESQGRSADALALTRQALFLAQQNQSADSMYLWQWQTARLLAALKDNDGAIAAYQRALSTLKTIRNDISLEYGNPNMRSSFREQAGPIYTGLADMLLRRADREKGLESEQSDMRQARSAVELLKSAEMEDYFQDKCAQLYKEQQQDIDALARQHQAAIVYIIPLADRTELLVTLPNGLRRFRSQANSDQLTKTVHEFREMLEKRTTNEYRIPARQIYDWLIAPVAPELKRQNVKTLVFVPDGALRTIPMAALIDENGKFLIESYPVAVTPGLSLMPPQPINRQNTVVLRSGLSMSKQGFPELGFVPGELARIGNLFGGTDLLNRTFTAGNVTRAMQNTAYTIVHIASHGEFRGDSKRTFLLTFDDRINLHDLEMLIEPSKFAGRPVELLMLSACQTAKGDDRAALGLAGVAVKAGARSAVATLWSVNDEASSQLVNEFYTQLHDHPNISKAEALRRAQMQIIAGKIYSHPAYWSAFLLIGNWQ